MRIVQADFILENEEVVLLLTVATQDPGWTNLSLSEPAYDEIPLDGLQELKLTATPPLVSKAEEVGRTHLEMRLRPSKWRDGVRIVSDFFKRPYVLRHPVYGGESAGQSRFDLNQVVLHEERMTISVSYSGGCASHRFRLGWDGNSSDGEGLKLLLSHNSNGDVCQAYLTEELSFDLSILPLPPGSKNMTVEGDGVRMKAIDSK